MNPRFLLILMLAALTCRVSFATGEKGSDAGGPRTILEVSPMSITVDAGSDVQESYAITATTTATLGGLPVKPADLRAGMVATLVYTSDEKSVVEIHAQPAPRTVRKPKPGDTTTIWIAH